MFEKLTRYFSSLDFIIQGILLLFIVSLPFKGLLFFERNLFLVLLVVSVIWVIVNRRLYYRSTALDHSLVTLVGWVAFTLLFAFFPMYSLREMGKLLECVLVFYAVVYFFHASHYRQVLVHLIIWLIGILVLYGLIQADFSKGQSMVSLTNGEVWLTTYLVMFVPLCFAVAYNDHSRWQNVIYNCIAMMGIACVILTRSRAGMVSLGIEMCILAWFLRTRLLFLTTVGVMAWCCVAIYAIQSSGDVGVVQLLINRNQGSVVHRFEIWRFTISEILKHPWVGIGFGNNSYLFFYGGSPELSSPYSHEINHTGTHNVFLYYALHVGIPGLFVFLWFLAQILRSLGRNIACASDSSSRAILAGVFAGIVGMLVRLQFDQMLLGSLAVSFYVLIAIGVLYSSLPSSADSGNNCS